MSEFVGSAWTIAKKWRAVSFGPVSLFMQFRKRQSLHHPRDVVKAVHVEEPLQLQRAASRLLGPALIVGTGPGLGYELAKTFEAEGIAFGVAARNGFRLEEFLRAMGSKNGSPFAVDATCETSVGRLFDDFEERFGESPRLVVYAVQDSSSAMCIELTLPALESALRSNCVGSFICAQQAAKRMLKAERGTIVFIGSTSSVIGRAGHLGLAVGRFGQRALAQVMARELSPQGIHVVHLIIDADIREDEEVAAHPQASPDDIAQIILQLHKQPRSAWTSEIDCRPWNENFWDHC